ncbi:MAG: type II toxin-antitoxin system VapC family toxin [Clostridiales bacterium]|nr:type II toxin-antitoxin system VapC family toxin [Clostridiales bacterium]
MKYLLDTHILLWAAAGNLPKMARKFFEEKNELYFSSASVWEVVIKRMRNKDDFLIDPKTFCSRLLEAGYKELPVTVRHALLLESLPEIHKDPFDRIMLSQALSEGMDFITADEKIAEYPCPVVFVR